MAGERLELWGGPECTVNRVGDRFGDQLVETGHHERDGDLDLIADLGLSAIRYPVLWERVSPADPQEHDWRWTDKRLSRLRDLGIRPIAGLVHHGSGPRYTNLLADDFPAGVAGHARAVAERYDWIDDWTPINEPVTTARFAAQYGHWYPHRSDEHSFWLALLNQVDATRLAMAEVRTVRPGAKLIQTDDLGRTYSTVALRDQAAFDNIRRWSGWDLLCGRLTPGHPLWARLCGFGLEDRLRAIADDPCPPDVIGVNHYLTSDRFLDHRVRLYPAAVAGTNGSLAYADVEAVRVLSPHRSGFEGVLREAWSRYGLPLALTEVHNGCTREEQLRWVDQAWRAAERLRDEGVQIRAVTIWSLFGSRGWDRLLTGPGHYESGVFDARDGAPRPTALSTLAKRLPATRDRAVPALEGLGWWQRSIRYHHPAAVRAAPMREHERSLAPSRFKPQPVMIAGAGMIGRALAAACRHRDIHHVLLDRRALDLEDPAAVEQALGRLRPWVVVNASGWHDSLGAEHDPARSERINVALGLALARACSAAGVQTVSFSSDLVFDGGGPRAYLESDPPRPRSQLGRHKAALEAALGTLPGSHLIIRSGAVFTPYEPGGWALRMLDRLTAQKTVDEPEDVRFTPSYLPHLCDAVLDLAIDGVAGLWALSNGQALSWAELARALAVATGRDPCLVNGVAAKHSSDRLCRPSTVELGSLHGAMLPTLEEAIASFAREYAQRHATEDGCGRTVERAPA
jgi:dTDP-4-dehydrorhamnose reductase